ncbi:hypothetical protein IWQ51_000851 [Labrenzia sp. EL_142]|nr:hypothetical protein [Labrenzia sp. EL_142]
MAKTGKIERWHQTLKNLMFLENKFLPGDIDASIERFVSQYDHRRNLLTGRRCLQRREAQEPRRPDACRYLLRAW